MRIRASSLFCASLFAFISLPAHAQGPGGPPPNYQQLVNQVAVLTAQVTSLQGQVARLEGNITAADLVGTYALAAITTRLDALIPASRNAAIGSVATTGTLALNADGSGVFTITTGAGSILTQGPWTLTPSSLGSAPGSGNITWTYDSGTVTVFLDGSPFFTVNVGPGGRLLVAAGGDFNAGNQRAQTELAIFTRLQ